MKMLPTTARLPLACVLLLGLVSACSRSEATTTETDPSAEAEPSAPDLSGIMSPTEFERLEGERGVVLNAEGAFAGLTLVMPLNSSAIHLLDLEGNKQHTWETGLAPGAWCYLLDDGTLLHAGRQDEDPHFRGGGIGGIVQQLAPDGEVLWRYDFADEMGCQHHDIEPLPNGNLLFISWERKSAEQAIAAGRDPRGVGAAGIWPCALYEIRPTLPEGAEVVWAWHAWDHLVQDLDPGKQNHGVLSEHPGRININAGFEAPDEQSEEDRKAAAELEAQMAALGYAGGEEDDEEEDDDKPKGPRPTDYDKQGDWLHTNAVDYNAELDLIVMSSPELGEIYVIDHSTSTEEAATSSGGRHGHGGDLLWRWGNPQRYGTGTQEDQRLFYQHDPNWLGSADDLRLLVFNNGGGRPEGKYSSVLELQLPFDAEHGFVREPNSPWGPAEPAWTYIDEDTFYSPFISGARRLPNGNTIICSGAAGRIFEVTTDGTLVWDYFSALGGDIDPPDHAGHAPPYALYRADRYSNEHPGVQALKH